MPDINSALSVHPSAFRLPPRKRHPGLLTIFVLFLLAATNCGGGDAAAPPDAQAQQQGQLICSEECAARGQCGTLLSNNQSVILGNPEQPAVSAHQLFFPADATLPIIGVQDVLLREPATGNEFTQPFYMISREDGRSGWVAGWCVNPQ
jgi:hypothetical protein